MVEFPQQISIVSAEMANKLAQQDLERALEVAQLHQCLEAEDWWFQSRKHLPHNSDWLKGNNPTIKPALAQCWAQKATEQPEQKMDHLQRARHWSYKDEHYRTAAKAAADEMYDQGMTARARGDWPAAYRFFDSTLRLEPQRAWARRYAEEARDHRLGLADRSAEQLQQEQKAHVTRLRHRRQKP